jgi:hypothetical protein
LQAERNRKQPVDYLLFGPDYRVEYAKKNSHLSNKHVDSHTWNVVVKHIPENVTEQCLRNLFVGCQFMRYIPARTACNTRKPSFISKKVLWG